MKIEIIEKGRMSEGEMGLVFGGEAGLCTVKEKYSSTQCMIKESCQPHNFACAGSSCSKHAYDLGCYSEAYVCISPDGTIGYKPNGTAVTSLGITGATTAAMSTTIMADAIKCG